MLPKTVVFSQFSLLDCWDDSSDKAADNVVELEMLEAMFLLFSNQAWS